MFGKGKQPKKGHTVVSHTNGPEGRRTVIHGKVVQDTTKGKDNKKKGK